MKIERKYLAHYIDAAPIGSSNAVYERLGMDLEEFIPGLFFIHYSALPWCFLLLYQPIRPDARKNKRRLPQKPPNMISISKSTAKVHSQYPQNMADFLMEHPILQNSKSLAIIKLQKRSESNVLTNLPNP